MKIEQYVLHFDEKTRCVEVLKFPRNHIKKTHGVVVACAHEDDIIDFLVDNHPT